MSTSSDNEASGNVCSTSSEGLPSTASSIASEEQSLSQEGVALCTVSTHDQTPISDMNTSGESSVTSPESVVSVTGVDGHIRASSSDSDCQFKFSVIP